MLLTGSLLLKQRTDTFLEVHAFSLLFLRLPSGLFAILSPAQGGSQILSHRLQGVFAIGKVIAHQLIPAPLFLFSSHGNIAARLLEAARLLFLRPFYSSREIQKETGQQIGSREIIRSSSKPERQELCGLFCR